MINIKLNYLYRDSGNYKQFGNVVLTNLNNLEIAHVEEVIRQNLIDQEFFSAEHWGLPTLYFHEPTTSDHEWHEFESVGVDDSYQIPTESIEAFLSRLT